MSDGNTIKRRGNKFAWIFVGVVALLLLVMIVAGLSSGSARDDAGNTAAPSSTATATPSRSTATPAPTTVPQPSSAPVAADPLAPRVEQALLEAWGVDAFTDGLGGGHDGTLLNWYIASITDVTPGTIEVIVQVTADQTTEEDAALLAKRIGTLVGDQLPELKWVVVQTADGKITEQVQAVGA